MVLAGASGALGSAIGARLAKAGARLVLFGRGTSRLAATCLPGLPVVGDLRDPGACASPCGFLASCPVRGPRFVPA